MVQKTILLAGSRQKSTFARNVLIRKENISFNFHEFSPEIPGVGEYFDLKRCKGSYIVKINSKLIMDWLEFSDENDLVVLEQRDLAETFTSWILSRQIDPRERNTKSVYTQKYKIEKLKPTLEDIENIYQSLIEHYEKMILFAHHTNKNKNMRLRFLPQDTLLNYSFEVNGVQKIWNSLEEKIDYIGNEDLIYSKIDELSSYHERCVNALSLLDYDEIII